MFVILAVIYVVFISLGLPDSLFGVAWPMVHIDFALPLSYASVYSIVTGVCSGGASFVAGKVLRKFGTPKVTLFSILLTVTGLLGTSFAPNLWVMMFFAVVLGYGAGSIDTGLNNYVSLHYKAKHMNWLHCFWGIGVTVSPLVMSQFLGESGEWRTGYRVIAGIQLSIALIVLFVLKKWIFEDKSLDEKETEQRSGEKPQLLSQKGVLSGILSLGCYCAMEFTIGTWGATYIVNTTSFAADTAAKWIAFYFGGIMLGRLVSGFISEKLSDFKLICFGLCIAGAGFVLLTLPFGNIALCGLVLIGFGFGPVFPSVLHSIPGRFGRKYSVDITGYHMGGAYAVGFFVQLVFGLVASNTTFYIMPFVLLVLAVVSFILNFATEKATSPVSAAQ